MAFLFDAHERDQIEFKRLTHCLVLIWHDAECANEHRVMCDKHAQLIVVEERARMEFPDIAPNICGYTVRNKVSTHPSFSKPRQTWQRYRRPVSLLRPNEISTSVPSLLNDT